MGVWGCVSVWPALASRAGGWEMPNLPMACGRPGGKSSHREVVVPLLLPVFTPPPPLCSALACGNTKLLVTLNKLISGLNSLGGPVTGGAGPAVNPGLASATAKLTAAANDPESNTLRGGARAQGTGSARGFAGAALWEKDRGDAPSWQQCPGGSDSFGHFSELQRLEFILKVPGPAVAVGHLVVFLSCSWLKESWFLPAL